MRQILSDDRGNGPVHPALIVVAAAAVYGALFPLAHELMGPAATTLVVGSVPGTGLGLVICKRIIDLHGGSISFETAEGTGTTMRFRIPGAVAAAGCVEAAVCAEPALSEEAVPALAAG